MEIGGLTSMVRRSRFLMIVALLVLVAPTGTALGDGQACLEGVAADVTRQHRQIGTMVPEEFESRLSRREPVLVFDVRERAEFDVSLIPGAVHVDPGITVADFMARYGGLIEGRTVLMYCSVGVRSSILAARVSTEAIARGAAGVYNLRGGVFAWHNTGRSLKHPASRNETSKVHPYSRSWSRYIDFDNHVSYGARPSWW